MFLRKIDAPYAMLVRREKQVSVMTRTYDGPWHNYLTVTDLGENACVHLVCMAAKGKFSFYLAVGKDSGKPDAWTMDVASIDKGGQ